MVRLNHQLDSVYNYLGRGVLKELPRLGSPSGVCEGFFLIEVGRFLLTMGNTISLAGSWMVKKMELRSVHALVLSWLSVTSSSKPLPLGRLQPGRVNEDTPLRLRLRPKLLL